jgi:pimeloyl-ACP methyl ester carboxylesterase
LLLGLLAGCDTVGRLEQRRLQRFHVAGMVEATAELDAGRVHYWSGGHGDPILLVHGFGGNAVWQWHWQVGPLTQAGARVIAPDLLWFGESVPHQPRFATEDQVAMLINLMDDQGIDRFDVMGSSYGGIIAFQLAHQHRDRVRRVILTDSPGPVFTQRDYDELLVRLQIPSFHALLIPEDPQGLRRLVEVSFHKQRVPGFLLDGLFEALYTSNREEKAALLGSVIRKYQQQADASRIPQPTLLVWGEHDRLFSLEIAHRVAGRLTGTHRLEVIPDAGHSPNLERPKRFNASVLAFLFPEPAA